MKLLTKNLGRRMPESAVREELESLAIQVQGVMQLRSGRRDQDPPKDRSPTPHFVVSMARGPVSKVRSLTGLCGLRVTVETYVPPKGPLHCKLCQRFGHTQRNRGHGPRCRVGGPHFTGTALPAGASLGAAAAVATTQRATGVVLSGRKRWHRLRDGRLNAAVEGTPPQASFQILSLQYTRCSLQSTCH